MSLHLARSCIYAAFNKSNAFEAEMVPNAGAGEHISKFILKHWGEPFAEVRVRFDGSIKVATAQTMTVFPYGNGSIERIPEYLSEIADQHFLAGL